MRVWIKYLLIFKFALFAYELKVRLINYVIEPVELNWLSALIKFCWKKQLKYLLLHYLRIKCLWIEKRKSLFGLSIILHYQLNLSQEYCLIDHNLSAELILEIIFWSIFTFDNIHRFMTKFMQIENMLPRNDLRKPIYIFYCLEYKIMFLLSYKTFACVIVILLTKMEAELSNSANS